MDAPNIDAARGLHALGTRGYIRHHAMDIRFAHSLFQALRGDRIAFGYSGSFR